MPQNPPADTKVAILFRPNLKFLSVTNDELRSSSTAKQSGAVDVTCPPLLSCSTRCLASAQGDFSERRLFRPGRQSSNGVRLLQRPSTRGINQPAAGFLSTYKYCDFSRRHNESR